MILKRDILLILIICVNVVSIKSNDMFQNVFNDPNFNPIFSIKITIEGSAAICEAHGILPVTYNITVFNTNGQYSIDNNVVHMKPENIYLIICESKINFINKTWTKTTLKSYSHNLQGSFLRLYNGSKPNEGLIQFYHSGQWRFICDDYFANGIPQYRKNGDVVCRELGYSGVDVLKSDGTFGRNKPFYMNNIVCTGHEYSLRNCTSDIASNVGCNFLTEFPAGVICLHPYVKIDELQSTPSYDIDINQDIYVECIFELNLKISFIFEMWHRKGLEGKMKSINIGSNFNVIKTNKTGFTVSFKFKHKPNKEYATDTFICMIKHVTGGIIDNKELHLKYKYPIEQLILEPITNTTSVPSNTSISVDSEITNNQSNVSTDADDDFSSASHIKCSGDYDSDNANFTWSYTGKNGTNYFQGQVLDLTKVEKRLPICCRLDDEMRSGPYNVSKCTTLQALPETPDLKTTTFCGTRSFDVKCPESTDMVFSSIHAGILMSCSQTKTYDHCQHHTVTNFVQEERCSDNNCRIFAGLFKKSFFKPILANLPADCLSGTKPFVKMSYYCLERFNSTLP